MAIGKAAGEYCDCSKDVPRSTTLGTMQITKDNAVEAYTKLGGTS